MHIKVMYILLLLPLLFPKCKFQGIYIDGLSVNYIKFYKLMIIPISL